jgi:hypothetical protein
MGRDRLYWRKHFIGNSGLQRFVALEEKKEEDEEKEKKGGE